MDDQFLAEAEDTTAPGDKLEQLSALGKELLSLEDQILAKENEVDELRKKHLELSQKKLPDLMDEVGVDRVGLMTVDVVLEPWFRASLPKDDPQPGIDWLDANGHGDLVKTTVTLEFGKGEYEKAKEIADEIAKRWGNSTQPTLKTGVHPMTLTAFVKEQITKFQAALPLDKLGASLGRVARIKKRSVRTKG